MANWINELIKKNRQKVFRPATHKVLDEVWYTRFKEWGEDLYYTNLQAKNNNIISTLIAKFSKGLSHTIAILYSENLRANFTDDEWMKVVASWNNYYGGTKELDSSIKVLVLASADEASINVFDFSVYQKRQLSIRKSNVSVLDKLRIILYLVSRLRKPYDYTGLAFWLLYKTCELFGFLDDPEADFCSELVYDGFKQGNCVIAKCANPSPGNIEDCAKDRIVFTNLTCL